VRLSSHGISATSEDILPESDDDVIMNDDDECGAVGEIIICRLDRSIQRKTVSVSLCPYPT
jgi:hypothetical protein